MYDHMLRPTSSTSHSTHSEYSQEEFDRLEAMATEFWGVKVNIIEARYRQPVDLRGIDPGHRFLQVFVDPFERKCSESGQGKASWQKWTLAFVESRRPFLPKGFEAKMKGFKAGQRLADNPPRP
jgi:hypothetical protein